MGVDSKEDYKSMSNEDKVVFFSLFTSIILEVNFFLDFLLGISKIDLEAILAIIKQG